MDRLDEDGADAVSFAPSEDGGRAHWLKLDHDVYEDMGRPEQITVTVEPGDLLNEPG